jgi:hypothetical protein
VIDSTRFDLIRQRHGGYASWAVWATAAERPTSNMGDLRVLDRDANPSLLETLNPGVVMVGLNLSRGDLTEPFRNFHDPRGVAKDFKIRFAFRDTEFWGAYMTDIIKGVVQPSSGELRSYLRTRPEVVQDNVSRFRSELNDLGHSKPLILAFGHGAHRLLKENLSVDDCALLVRLTHYSDQISKEAYREMVHQQILQARHGTA